ncbi:MAG: BatA and WFA domain-containing protein [Lachnospiraceae bacterium]|nr:BatA and WFA domain-containing protein [Lachnospiraceae bacterium]
MIISKLWPVAFIVLVPLIVLLYVLKQKGKDITVSSTYLWREAIKNTEATTPWEKFKNNILMYLQILTVLFLIAALMAPVLKKGGGDYKEAVIVIDDSASMGYIYKDEVTRLDEAKKRARSYVDSLNDNCEITLLKTTGGGQVVLSNAIDKRSVKQAIDDIKQTALTGDADEAAAIVKSLASNWSRYGVTIFTDTPVTLNDLTADVINLYSEGKNYAVEYVNYGIKENGKLTVLAKIDNFASDDTTIEVNLYGDGQILDIKSISVPANSSQVVYFEDIDFRGELIEAEVNNKDYLADDNKSGCIVTENSGKRVLLVTAGNTFLEKALNSVGRLDVFKTTDLSVIGKNESYDLYIFDSVVPDEFDLPGSVLYINPEGAEGLGVEGSIENSLITFSKSELSNYLEKAEVGVNHSLIFKRPAWAMGYLNNGDDCCGYYGEDGKRRIVTLGFDIHSSDVALKPEFPMLIYNIVNYTLEAGLTDNCQIMTGEKIKLYSRSDSNMSVKKPDGKVSEIDKGLVSKVYTDTDMKGVYTVSQETEDGTNESLVYASFPVKEESDVAAGESVKGGEAGNDVTPSGGKELRNLFILLLLFTVVLEWAVYIYQS